MFGLGKKKKTPKQQYDTTAIAQVMENGDFFPVAPMRPQTEHIVVASNQSSPEGLFAIGVLLIVGGCATTFYLIHSITGSKGWAGVVALSLFFITGLLSMTVFNGDLPAIINILTSEKTERKRIFEWGSVTRDLIGFKLTAENNRHAERMAEIEREGWEVEMDRRVAFLEDTNRALLEDSANKVVASPGNNYVTGTLHPEYREALDWARSLYDGNGNLDWTKVARENGQVLDKMAWNGVWLGEGWKAAAKELLTQRLDPKFLLQVPGTKNWAVNTNDYPTVNNVNSRFARQFGTYLREKEVLRV